MPVTDPTKTELTDEQKTDAVIDGKKDAVAEGAKQAQEASIGDEPTEEDLPERVFPKGPYEVSRYEYIVDMSLADMKAAIEPLTEDKVAGLMEVEKSGKNRADVVALLEDRLGLKADDVTGAGPRYENVVQRTEERTSEPNPLNGGEYVRP